MGDADRLRGSKEKGTEQVVSLLRKAWKLHLVNQMKDNICAYGEK